MDQNKLNKLIKKNRGILRQLTNLNNRVKELEKVIGEVTNSVKMFNRRRFEVITRDRYSEEEIANIKVGGTDPD